MYNAHVFLWDYKRSVIEIERIIIDIVDERRHVIYVILAYQAIIAL